MQKIFLCIIFILILLPISSAFSQKSDTLPTLSVALTSDSPFVYQDNEGYTIVVGNVENKNENTSINNVQLRVSFYDETGVVPLETVQGGTILDVIPEKGNSPYMIKSTNPNPNITQASVMLEGFLPSPSKSQKLVVEASDASLSDNLQLTGVLNNGGSPITDTFVYLAFYDGFIPPRLVGVSTIPIGQMEADERVDFHFNEKIDPRTKSYQIFAQSNVFYSNFVEGTIPEPLTRLVTISNVALNDSTGAKLSEIKVGTTVNIQSNVWVQFSADQKSNETPYTYYAQVKNSGLPTVEFLGKFDGRFIGTGSQSISIDWIPEHEGIFFIETFVWDRNGVPIADKGPIVLLVVS